MFLKFFISLVCVVLSARSINSWDLAVSLGGEIDFLHRNGTHIKTVNHQFTDLTALTFDPVGSSFFFAATNHSNHTVFGFHVDNDNNVEGLIEQNFTDSVYIQGLTVDPVSETLFWTDRREGKSGRVMHTLLTPGQNNFTGIPLFEMNDEIPRGIAVDSCRGMIYWTNTNTPASIERSTIDGKNRTIIISTGLSQPLGITVDVRLKKIFWCDDRPGIHFGIEMADLDGGNREEIHRGIDHQPFGLAVGHGFIYWTDRTAKSLWKKPIASDDIHSDPTKVIEFGIIPPTSVVVNVDIAAMTQGINECHQLHKTVKAKSTTDLRFSSSSTSIQDTLSSDDQPLYCLRQSNFRKVDGVVHDELCMCSKNVFGKRCESEVCKNYCLNGKCEVDGEGHPKCSSCFEGYTGERCEVNMCTNFCINGGNCTISSKKAVCNCPEGFEGERCHVKKEITNISSVVILERKQSLPKTNSEHNLTIDPVDLIDSLIQGKNNEDNNDTRDDSNNRSKNQHDPNTNSNRVQNNYLRPVDASILNQLNDTNVVNVSIDRVSSNILSQSKSIMDCDCLAWSSPPLIAVYTCSIFLLLSTFLLAIILIRRPRIKKRHIVPKTFMKVSEKPKPSNREISIETCCNMELCETPCYQSGSIQSDVKDQSAKEEQKSLLINIELNNDDHMVDCNRRMYPVSDFHK